MPKRTIALFIIIAIITILLVVAAFAQLRKQGMQNTGTQDVNNEQLMQPTPEDIAKTASLSFSPLSVQGIGSIQTADIVVDTGGNSITGVQAELQYDPKKITNVSILPASTNALFGARGQELIKEVRSESGRISYAVVINPNDQEVKGIGSIATLQFQTIQGLSGETQISFLEKSLVTSIKTQKSLLNGTVPLTITLSSISTSSGQITRPTISPTTPTTQ